MEQPCDSAAFNIDIFMSGELNLILPASPCHHSEMPWNAASMTAAISYESLRI